MTTTVNSIGLKGMEEYKVQVEVQVIPGKAGFSIIGLPDKAVKESRERVLAALFENQCTFSFTKLVINLSPVERKKNMPFFDLAMALGIMIETHHIRMKIESDTAFLGCLSLDGVIESVEGMLPAIIAAKKENIKTLYLPYIQDINVTKIDGIELRFVRTLDEVLKYLTGQKSYSTPEISPQLNSPKNNPNFAIDFKQILGQAQAKRALEIAAAGGHHVLMISPPGCGKSMLAEAFPSILPSMTQNQQLEMMSIYQLAGIKNENLIQPPFRAPHHTSSAISLIGGGSYPKPGEMSLAHHGVLFLDELAEFPKRTIDMVRQPIESGKVTISRAASTVTYPSRFILLGAMNPCPCGYLHARSLYCTCTTKQISAYHHRISGPMLDRFDIILNLSPVSFENEKIEQNELSKKIQSRVIRAREQQYDRYGLEVTNANAPLSEIRPLTSNQQNMLQHISSKHDWSTRVQIKIIRLARTISDLSGDSAISDESIWEAMTLRRNLLGKEKRKVLR